MGAITLHLIMILSLLYLVALCIHHKYYLIYHVLLTVSEDYYYTLFTVYHYYNQ